MALFFFINCTPPQAGFNFPDRELPTEWFFFKSSGLFGQVVEGFGWTNGVILDLLRVYGSELSWETSSLVERAVWSSSLGQLASSSSSTVVAASVLFVLLVVLG